ncbi:MULTISPECIES: hypothetical protein [unclassified Streptomyces]|uniref:hypothetical protein n=1 Tax=unclassified Streptomyces TaxID=2593676 RepID=UPI00382011A1
MSGAVDDGAASRSLQKSLDDEKFTVPQLQAALKTMLEDTASAEPDGWLTVEGWNFAGLLPAGTAPHHSMLDALPTRGPDRRQDRARCRRLGHRPARGRGSGSRPPAGPRPRAGTRCCRQHGKG